MQTLRLFLGGGTPDSVPVLRGVSQKAQRQRLAPAVYPAPTAANNTKSPFLRRPSVMASSVANGMVAAVVLPYLSRLITTRSGEGHA